MNDSDVQDTSFGVGHKLKVQKEVAWLFLNAGWGNVICDDDSGSVVASC